MGIKNFFARIFGRREVLSDEGGVTGTKNPLQWFIDWVGGGNKSAAGIAVNHNIALKYSAVWAATRIICESVASLPCILYEKRADSWRKRATGHPLFKLLRFGPNPRLDQFTFWEMMTHFLVNWGNAFAEIERTIGGQILHLWPIHPSRVRAERFKDGSVLYWVKSNDGTEVPIDTEHMFNVVGCLSEDGVFGRGVIPHAKESIGFGLAAERYGARFFANDAVPVAVVELQRKVDEPQLRDMRKDWHETYSGENARGIGFLQSGAQLKVLSISNECAQYVESRAANVLELSRFYRVPPHFLSDLTRSTFSNAETEGIYLVTYTLRPWLVRIEAAVARQLLSEEEREDYYVEFLVDALLRGDSKSRSIALKTQFVHGALTLDEWCRLENREPPGGEVGRARFVPKNMTTAERLVEGTEDAEGPFEKQPEEPGESNDTQAAKIVFDATLARLQATEANAIKRAAKKPGQFLQRLEEFYEKYEGLLAEAMHPVEVILSLANQEFDARAFATTYCAASRQRLLAAAECKPAELEDSVATCLLPAQVNIMIGEGTTNHE